MSFTSPPTIYRHYTVSFSDVPINTLFSRLTPIHLWQYRWSRRIRIFGITIARIRITITLSLDTVSVTFPTGSPVNTALVNFMATLSLRVSNLATVSANILASVSLYLDPNFAYIMITPQFVSARVTVRLFGGLLRFSFTQTWNLSYMQTRINLPNSTQTINFPAPINRSVTMRPANGMLRTVSGYLIAEGDLLII